MAIKIHFVFFFKFIHHKFPTENCNFKGKISLTVRLCEQLPLNIVRYIILYMKKIIKDK